MITADDTTDGTRTTRGKNEIELFAALLQKQPQAVVNA